LTSKKDGLILQKYQNTSSKGKMTYRRKEVDTKVFRKAMISALI
jgi:hypothetical protein